MIRIEQSDAAKRDLDEIWDYIARQSTTAADRFLEQIWIHLLRVAETPDLGITRRWLSPGLRVRVHDRYLLFYRPIDDGIELVRVIHGARRIHRGMFT